MGKDEFECAVRIILFLAIKHDTETSEDIAYGIKTPLALVSPVLGRLIDTGIIVPNKNGCGDRLCDHAEQLTLDVIHDSIYENELGKRCKRYEQKGHGIPRHVTKIKHHSVSGRGNV